MTPQKACTTSGLGRALGVARNTLMNYENPKHYTNEVPEDVRPELMSTISDAKRRVEEFTESQLFEQGQRREVQPDQQPRLGRQDHGGGVRPGPR
jgi:hypothetical protein